jgi:protein-disulfide isomerase
MFQRACGGLIAVVLTVFALLAAAWAMTPPAQKSMLPVSVARTPENAKALARELSAWPDFVDAWLSLTKERMRPAGDEAKAPAAAQPAKPSARAGLDAPAGTAAKANLSSQAGTDAPGNLGPSGSQVRPAKAEAADAVEGAGRKAELFLSFSCPYCRDTWRKMRSSPSMRAWTEGPDFTLTPLHESAPGAMACVVYRLLSSKDKAVALAYVDWVMARADAAMRDEASMHAATADFLAQAGPASLASLSAGVDSKALGEAILADGRRFQETGAKGVPAVIVDGKPDSTYLGILYKAMEGRDAASSADAAVKALK